MNGTVIPDCKNGGDKCREFSGSKMKNKYYMNGIPEMKKLNMKK